MTRSLLHDEILLKARYVPAARSA